MVSLTSSAVRASTDDLPHIPSPSANGEEHPPAMPPPLTALIVAPTLEAGAADEGAVDVARILAGAGHHAVVVSCGGRLESALTECGAQFVRLNAKSHNPFVISVNALTLLRLIRERRCDVVHAHGRAPAWSALMAARLAGVPFLTTCYAGFREQNMLKRWYNSVMTRGDRVITASDPLAEMIVERHRIPWERISVIHSSIDLSSFDPAAVNEERIRAARAAWGVKGDVRVVLVAGRMIRRKGHHVVVQAARRLKDMGLKNFLFVFDGEDPGRSRYSGQLWDLVLATNTADVIRMPGPPADVPACRAAATVVLSAATQLEGLQRALIEGMAMERPVIASDLAAGPEAVLAPPAVGEERMTGLRFPAGDDAALAATLIRFFSYSDAARQAMGRRARDWVLTQFDRATAIDQTLAVYAMVSASRRDRAAAAQSSRK